MRNTSFLGKLLALTESTNEHEANLAKAKLEEQLEKRGINLDQLEQQLGDLSVVEEEKTKRKAIDTRFFPQHLS